jgi:hypothetical protein
MLAEETLQITDAQQEFREALSRFMNSAEQHFMLVRRQPRQSLAHCLAAVLGKHDCGRVVHCSRYQSETEVLNACLVGENNAKLARHVACGAEDALQVPLSPDHTVGIYNRLWCTCKDEWTVMQRIARASSNATVKLIFIMESLSRDEVALDTDMDAALWHFYQPGGLRAKPLSSILVGTKMSL